MLKACFDMLLKASSIQHFRFFFRYRKLRLSLMIFKAVTLSGTSITVVVAPNSDEFLSSLQERLH